MHSARHPPLPNELRESPAVGCSHRPAGQRAITLRNGPAPIKAGVSLHAGISPSSQPIADIWVIYEHHYSLAGAHSILPLQSCLGLSPRVSLLELMEILYTWSWPLPKDTPVIWKEQLCTSKQIREGGGKEPGPGPQQVCGVDWGEGGWPRVLIPPLAHTEAVSSGGGKMGTGLHLNAQMNSVGNGWELRVTWVYLLLQTRGFESHSLYQAARLQWAPSCKGPASYMCWTASSSLFAGWSYTLAD